MASGDRPAEETCECTHGEDRHLTLATSNRCVDCTCDGFVPTPPAVRTGDDAEALRQVRRMVDALATVPRQAQWLHIDALNAALSASPPVSGTAARDDVVARARHWLVENTRTLDSERWLGDAADSLGDAADSLLLALGVGQPAGGES